jgi:primosomal protein N'
MIARVALEIALDKEFDYSVPDDLSARIMVGSWVLIPFGARTVKGYVTKLL